MAETTMRLDGTEALFSFDVTDDELEIAANSGLEGGAYTVAFCTGLDSCPAAPAA